jgi:hypothetical protein
MHRPPVWPSLGKRNQISWRSEQVRWIEDGTLFEHLGARDQRIDAMKTRIRRLRANGS